MWPAVWWGCLFIACSVFYDFHTYTDRQDRWERDHPGATYKRGYNKALRKGAKEWRSGT